MENRSIGTQQPEPKKKKTLTEKLRENPWMVFTYAFGLCILLLLIFYILNPIPHNFFIHNDTIPNEDIFNETSAIKILTPNEVCPQIKAVPSWIRGNEIMEGYTNFNDESSSDIIDNLIKNNIYFVWSSTCSVCAKQKLLFGDDWQKYMDSGYTIKCG